MNSYTKEKYSAS